MREVGIELAGKLRERERDSPEYKIYVVVPLALQLLTVSLRLQMTR